MEPDSRHVISGAAPGPDPVLLRAEVFRGGRYIDWSKGVIGYGTECPVFCGTALLGSCGAPAG